MHRTFAALIAFLAFVSLAAIVFAAEADGARANRPVWGMVTKVTADSVTIAPEVAVRRTRKPAAAPKPANEQKPAAEKPAERTFLLAKDETEFAFAEVGMRRLMFDGTTLRTLTEPEPATAADLKVGQLVEVTPVDDAAARAKRVIISWSMPATIVKVDAEMITFRPVARAANDRNRNDADADAAPKQDGDDDNPAAPDAEDQTVEISKTTTRVRIATASEPPPGAGGRVVTTIEYKDGVLGDLKPDQSVIICIKKETAAKITILAAADGKL